MDCNNSLKSVVLFAIKFNFLLKFQIYFENSRTHTFVVDHFPMRERENFEIYFTQTSTANDDDSCFVSRSSYIKKIETKTKKQVSLSFMGSTTRHTAAWKCDDVLFEYSNFFFYFCFCLFPPPSTRNKFLKSRYVACDSDAVPAAAVSINDAVMLMLLLPS